MVDRYVNYDKLLEERHRLGLDEMSKIHKVNAFNQFIDNLPTADVVEVKCRCSECKYLKIINKESVYAECERQKLTFLLWQADTREHTCSYGTPKERGGES